MFLPHMASRLYGTPLLLARSKLDIILNVLGERVGWPASVPDAASLAPSVKFARFEASSALNLSQDLSSVASGIAVIGIAGSLVRRNIGVDAQSGLSVLGSVRHCLRCFARSGDPNQRFGLDRRDRHACGPDGARCAAGISLHRCDCR